MVFSRPLDEDEAREIRRMKARVETERIRPPDDPAFHLKLGPGTLSDVEWTVQLLQLRAGADDPSVRTASTTAGLDALVAGGHLDAADAELLAASYRFCERARNARYLHLGAKADSLPTRPGRRPTWGGCSASTSSRRPRCGSCTARSPAAPGPWWSDCSTTAGTRGTDDMTELAADSRRSGPRSRPIEYVSIKIAVPDPPETIEANPIHGAAGAAAAGYAGALVAGVHTYGWATAAVLDAFGDRWLDDGWADVSYRRPVYDGDELVTTATRDAGEPALSCRCARWPPVSGLVLDGTAGVGRAPWFDELEVPEWRDPQPPVPEAELVRMELASAPVHRDFRPMAVDATRSFATAWASTRLEDHDARWYEGDRPRLHPSFLAGRMTPLFRHNYRYGPAIHVRTQIQHLAAGPGGPAARRRRPPARRLRAQGPPLPRERLLDLRRGRHRPRRQAPHRHLQAGEPLSRGVATISSRRVPAGRRRAPPCPPDRALRSCW